VTVTQQEERGWRRWVCGVCDWCTEWVAYTAADHATAAIRHELEHRKVGEGIAL
jgi:hypothetical protein